MKLSLLADNTAIYVKNATESTKRLAEYMSLAKLQHTSLISKKSIVLLYTSSELPEIENSFKIPFTGTSLVVQWLRIPITMQGTWVRSLVRELRSHMLWGN